MTLHPETVPLELTRLAGRVEQTVVAVVQAAIDWRVLQHSDGRLPRRETVDQAAAALCRAVDRYEAAQADFVRRCREPGPP